MTQSEYVSWYSSLIFLIGVTSCLYICSSRQKGNTLPTVSSATTFLLCILVVFGIACCPSGLGSDKSRYEEMFLYAERLEFTKDVAWQYYTRFSKLILRNVFLFFLVTASFYVWSYYEFIKRYVDKKNRYYIFLLVVGSLGFYSYGVNTIRAGMALGFILLAIVNKKNVMFFILYSVISICFHKSMFIPFVAFLVTFVCKNTKIYMLFWFFMLLCSFLNISAISDFIQFNFSSYDNRIVDYMSASENELYTKAGFRFDFIIYSLFPIVLGYFYISMKKFEDEFYIHIYNTYLVVNAFWLLVIRIPYTDRFAYLSWFLSPFILIYPLFNGKFISNRKEKLAGVLFVMLFLNFILTIL